MYSNTSFLGATVFTYNDRKTFRYLFEKGDGKKSYLSDLPHLLVASALLLKNFDKDVPMNFKNFHANVDTKESTSNCK